jgi:hypothetical protein
MLYKWSDQCEGCKNCRQSVLGYYPAVQIIFFSFLFAVLFILPQMKFFMNWTAHFFVRDFWQYNQGLVVSWRGVHLLGKIWSFRVNDTLGGIGIVLAILSIPFFWGGVIQLRREIKIRIYILAVLPFLGYCIPIFHFVWLSNVKPAEYYRLCYSSMFWLMFSVFFQQGERLLWSGFCKMNKRSVHK